jgi:hypothetical protein
MANINIDHSPVFIGGMRRSGTTLLRKVIGSHPDIACLSTEFRFFDKFYSEKEIEPDQFDQVLSHIIHFLSAKNLKLSEASLQSRLNGYEKSWRNLFIAVLEEYRLELGKRICGDKSPLYEFYLPQLREWFPNNGFYFVHVLRDPLDCYASHKFHSKKLGLRNPVDWALAWNKSTGIALVNAAQYPETYLSIRYEDFIGTPDLFVEKFCRMVKVQLKAERMLSMADYKWQLTDSSTFLHSSEDISREYRGKIRTADSVDRKKLLDEEETMIIKQYCGPLALLAGYEHYKEDLCDLKAVAFHHGLAKKILDELSWVDYIKDIQIKYSFQRLRGTVQASFSSENP